uniref:Uncharacterized protein n=1 Tax=Anopheles funestus TaxID=62324 RepID=A0A182S0T2_ANOFN
MLRHLQFIAPTYCRCCKALPSWKINLPVTINIYRHSLKAKATSKIANSHGTAKNRHKHTFMSSVNLFVKHTFYVPPFQC